MAIKTNKSDKTKNVSLRMTNALHAKLMAYATAHDLTQTKAIEELLEKALKAQSESLATKTDIELLLSETRRLQDKQESTQATLMQAIQNQPITIQELALKEKENKPKGLFSRLFKGD